MEFCARDIQQLSIAYNEKKEGKKMHSTVKVFMKRCKGILRTKDKRKRVFLLLNFIYGLSYFLSYKLREKKFRN